jgi:hypothetical protein
MEPAGMPLPTKDQFTPAFVLRKTPLPVAAKSLVGVPGVTAIRLNRVPAKVEVASTVHEAPPFVDFKTPLP